MGTLYLLRYFISAQCEQNSEFMCISQKKKQEIFTDDLILWNRISTTNGENNQNK